jgi:hypothetical protein
MGLDDKVYSEVNPEEPRNENLEGGKSTSVHKEEAAEEKAVARDQERVTEPKKDPDEIKSSSKLLPEDAQKKADLSAGDSQ